MKRFYVRSATMRCEVDAESEYDAVKKAIAECSPLELGWLASVDEIDNDDTVYVSTVRVLKDMGKWEEGKR